MVAWMDYLTSRDVGVVGPFPLYSQNPGTKIMVTVFILQPTFLGMLETWIFPGSFVGHIFQCWYWNIVLGMHETRLRDDLLCKSKRRKTSSSRLCFRIFPRRSPPQIYCWFQVLAGNGKFEQLFGNSTLTFLFYPQHSEKDEVTQSIHGSSSYWVIVGGRRICMCVIQEYGSRWPSLTHLSCGQRKAKSMKGIFKNCFISGKILLTSVQQQLSLKVKT